MAPHGHGHHGGGHHHGGGLAPGWGGGWGGWWDEPGAELIVVDATAESDRDRKLAYIATLPEKARAAAFAKLFGPVPAATSGCGGDCGCHDCKKTGVAGALGDMQSFVTNNWPFLLIGTAGLLLILRKRQNPRRRRRR
jgi:hypothetical protein